MELLRAAVRAGAVSPVPYQDLDAALARAGQLSEALQALQEGLARFPYAPALHKMLVVRYIALKRYPEARAAIARYLDLFPEDAFMRGMLRKFDAAAPFARER